VRAELLPHAGAEEQALYPVAAAQPCSRRSTATTPGSSPPNGCRTGRTSGRCACTARRVFRPYPVAGHADNVPGMTPERARRHGWEPGATVRPTPPATAITPPEQVRTPFPAYGRFPSS
jgi:hypothetical protein